MTAHITALYRYPVKGFSAEPLERVEIAAGGTFPFDRAWAIENGPSGFDPNDPAYFPKIRFLMLMKNERMAEFTTRYDDATGIFRVEKDGNLLAEGALGTAEGRAALEAWLAETFRDELRGPPKILSAAGHSFSDKKGKVLHLVNLATVRALEKQFDRPVDPMRFRPNIVIDGAPAWSEFDWVTGEVRLPAIRLAGESRTTRCAAVNVDPRTARRDMELPRALAGLYNHMDVGIYLVAATAGAIMVGDTIEPVQAKLALAESDRLIL